MIFELERFGVDSRKVQHCGVRGNFAGAQSVLFLTLEFEGCLVAAAAEDVGEAVVIVVTVAAGLEGAEDLVSVSVNRASISLSCHLVPRPRAFGHHSLSR